jgi:hypothetical protein
MFRIVTDGQLPIRQCLHRESSIKDIELPEYYNVFHDLRKDFSKFYNAPQDQTFNSITDLVNCILLYYVKKKTIAYSSSLLPVSTKSLKPEQAMCIECLDSVLVKQVLLVLVSLNWLATFFL